MHLLLLTIFSLHISAQSSNIKGILTDTLNSPLVSATILLLDKDSTLIEYTQTELDGSFEFKKISKGDYLLKTTYVGFLPLTMPISTGEKILDLGKIKMKEIAIELYEVVIKAAKAPMKIRGDTIEYDATTFKVPEGSTVEDLIRRLPGMEVQQDGSLKSDGKDVTKVTVEGKSFFGGDPKTATKNLPAEGVSKIQVFDKKTEEQKVTGDKSSSKEKEMNITLKEEFKKGGFGKVIAGAGDKDRYELKGNYNRFNDKHQFSVVGVGNNTGRNGLGWDDYQDFMGSQSFSFSDGDLEYGFAGGGMRFFSFGGNNDGLESSISNIFFSGGSRNGGFPISKNGGVNYNYDHNKKKLGARYFYNNNSNKRETTETSTTYLNDYTTDNEKTSETNNNFDGHRTELTYEQEIDSFNTFVINGSFASVASDESNTIKEFTLRNRESVVNDAAVNNFKNFAGNLFTGSAIYRKTFKKKKGRFFGFNASYQNTNVDDHITTNSDLKFYNEFSGLDSSKLVAIKNFHDASKNNYKFNTTFNEPLSKIFSWSIFYNFSQKNQEGNIAVSQPGFEIDYPILPLSRTYTNNIFYNRAGSTIRYAKNGINIGLGLAYIGFDIKANIIQASNPTVPIVINTPYNNIIPNLSMNFDIGKNAYISSDFYRSIQEPNINQLIPIIDNRNPLYITEGNPDLKPTDSNRFSLYGSRSWPADGIRFSINGSFTKYNNNIISNTTVNDATQSRYSKPVNFQGGNDAYSYISFSFPIKKNRLKTSLGMRLQNTNTFAYVNNILNQTTNFGTGPRINLDFTPSNNFGLYLTGNIDRTNTKYNISTSENQIFYNKNISAQLNANLGKNIFLATNYRHSFLSGANYGGSASIPILDASIYKQFLKGKRGEIRLSLYDAFNKNRQFNQMATANLVSQSNTPSLARYFLASFTYNLRGMVGTVDKVW